MWSVDVLEAATLTEVCWVKRKETAGRQQAGGILLQEPSMCYTERNKEQIMFLGFLHN
jgi:hypothetical protein